MLYNKSLANYFLKASVLQKNIFIILVVFFTYFCSYGFRKAFTAATFEGSFSLGFVGEMDYKILLIISQILGYMTAKFLGIKLIAEVSKDYKKIALYVASLLTIAGFCWVFVAIVPPPYNAFFIALNGFPLGLIWGLVFSLVEGREHTEVLGAGLSVSYIFAASFSQQVGDWLLNQGISEIWMPFYASLVYFFPMLIFVWFLAHLPPPSYKDEQLRTKRVPMNAQERGKFMKTFALGITLITIAYLFLNSYREFRSNFAKEISESLDFAYSSFTFSEPIISLILLVILGLFYKIKNNNNAFQATLGISILGAILVVLATLLRQASIIPAWFWMNLVGLGVYAGYVAISAFTFDRLIAVSKWIGNVGFLIYLIDAVAYIGSITIFIIKNYFSGFDVVIFIDYLGIFLGILNVILLLITAFYFKQKINVILKATK